MSAATDGAVSGRGFAVFLVGSLLLHGLGVAAVRLVPKPEPPPSVTLPQIVLLNEPAAISVPAETPPAETAVAEAVSGEPAPMMEPTPVPEPAPAPMPEPVAEPPPAEPPQPESPPQEPPPQEPLPADPLPLIESVAPVVETLPPLLPPPPEKPKPEKPKPLAMAKPKPAKPPKPVTAKAATVAVSPAAAPSPPPPPPPAVPRTVGPPPQYVALIQSRLLRAKRYPAQARRLGQEGTVLLRFSVDRDGGLAAWRIVRGSGVAALDDEVAAMLQRAAPFPPFPDHMNSDRLDLEVPVEFQLTAG